MGEEWIRRMMVLGSVPNLGPVVLSDDIESLLKWTEDGTGGDTVFEKITTVAYNGTASLHMKTRTTNAAENDMIQGYRDFFSRPGKRYRMECLFRPDVAAQSHAVFGKVTILDGVADHLLRVFWDVAATKWIYWNSAAGYSDIPGASQNLVADQFHRLLVEWDQNKREYIRFVCDGLEVSMAGLGYESGANAGAQVARLDLGMTAGAAPPGEAYFDDVLVMEI